MPDVSVPAVKKSTYFMVAFIQLLLLLSLYASYQQQAWNDAVTSLGMLLFTLPTRNNLRLLTESMFRQGEYPPDDPPDFTLQLIAFAIMMAAFIHGLLS